MTIYFPTNKFFIPFEKYILTNVVNVFVYYLTLTAVIQISNSFS